MYIYIYIYIHIHVYMCIHIYIYIYDDITTGARLRISMLQRWLLLREAGNGGWAKWGMATVTRRSYY